MQYTLYIGNKNYSSWSMRPWLVMDYFNLPFQEQWLHFDDFKPQSAFKQAASKLSPFASVPILVDGDLVVTDSLAICEYLSERHPDLALWPILLADKVTARNLVTYMHSGFMNIRRHFPMNIEAELSHIGQITLRDNVTVKREIAFFDSLLKTVLDKSTGPYLFGQFSIADAFYAPMCMRMQTYTINLSTEVQNYVDCMLASPSVKKWIDAALQEQQFVIIDEPYRIEE